MSAEVGGTGEMNGYLHELVFEAFESFGLLSGQKGGRYLRYIVKKVVSLGDDDVRGDALWLMARDYQRGNEDERAAMDRMFHHITGFKLGETLYAIRIRKKEREVNKMMEVLAK